MQATPRWATRRRPERPTIGGRVAKVAELLGQPLMPWQRQVADVMGEVDPSTGELAYPEVWVTVPRQQGKTTLVLAAEVERCTSWPSPQRVAYSAQNGFAAKAKLIDDQVPMLMGSPLELLVDKIRRSSGDWGVEWVGGSRIDVVGSSDDAGHGRVIDLAVLDEVWRDYDDRREQALLPAMITRSSSQMLGASTMGTDQAVYLNRKVAIGREAALADVGHGVAYFEWSIPPDADVDDPRVWWRHLPALGHTITERSLAHNRQSMSDGEFRRAFGNQVAEQDEQRVIPTELWVAARDAHASPGNDFRFGVDVSHDRGRASIAASDGVAVEMIAVRPGVGWVRDWFAESRDRRRVPVVMDAGGPGDTLIDELERDRVNVQKANRGQVAAACGRLYDALADGTVRVRPGSSELDEAVEGLVAQPLGDRWVWSRARSTADASPLIAATLAFGAPLTSRQAPQVRLLS